jgi:NADH:ubiquinone oxidoreductase subunit F (NADH-binding)
MHNIETLAGIALVSVHGSAWFRAEGTLSEPGTGIFGVGEFGTEPTLYERPLGYSLRQLLRDAGRLDGCTAVVVGGWSGGIIAVGDTEVALTEKDLRAAGATLGTKSVQTIPVSRCVVGVAAEIIAFLAGETAGQCVPCRDGLPWLADRLARLEAGGLPEADLEEVFAFGTSLTGRGLCAMPDGAARILGSLRTNFADVLHAHAGGCPHHA